MVCKKRVAPGAAMIGKGYNGTPAQPQPQAMGAARRDPRRGEIPVTCASTVRQLPPRAREVVSNRTYNLISDYGGHLFSTSGRYACGIKYDTHEGGKSMEMNSVMATEIVAAEVEHIVLPQIVSICLLYTSPSPRDS